MKRNSSFRKFAAATLVLSLIAPFAAQSEAVYQHSLSESFNTGTWWQRWGLDSAPDNTAVVADLFKGNVLRVRFHQGSHYGTSFWHDTGAADEVVLAYRIRFAPNWVPMLNGESGKIPGFGNVNFNSDGSCEYGCGCKPVDGTNGYSVRASFGTGNTMGSYVYHAEMPQTAPSCGTFLPWDYTMLNGVWYHVQQHVKLNTPGVHDGALTVQVNGSTVLSQTELLFRTTDTIHVGGAWFMFYYGGSATSPVNTWIDIDDVTIQW